MRPNATRVKGEGAHYLAAHRDADRLGRKPRPVTLKPAQQVGATGTLPGIRYGVSTGLVELFLVCVYVRDRARVRVTLKPAF